jgi:AraC family transcriptional regulator of arabinose operon
MSKENKIKKTTSYPGVDRLKERIRSRHINSLKRDVRLGFGFMNKSGKRVDEENFNCPYYALVYVIRGTGEYVLNDGTRFPLKPGSVFQRHPGILHSTYLDPASNWSECFLDFGKGLYESLVECSLLNKKDFVFQMGPDMNIESEFYLFLNRLEICSDKELPFLIADSVSFLSKIIQRCTAVTESETDLLIEKVSVELGQNINKRIDLRQYCREKGLGYENFRKLFRNKVGVSPGKYIIRRRLDAACQMLLVLDKTIGEIAIDLGYKSQYEFSAQFKKFIGTSPKKYRINRGGG